MLLSDLCSSVEMCGLSLTSVLFLGATRQSGNKDPWQNQAGSENPKAAVQRDFQHGETTPSQRHTPLWGLTHTHWFTYELHVISKGFSQRSPNMDVICDTSFYRWWRHCHAYTSWWSMQEEESSTARSLQRGNSRTLKARSSLLRSSLL